MEIEAGLPRCAGKGIFWACIRVVTYRVGERLAGRGPAGTLCSLIMGTELVVEAGRLD